MKDIESLFNKKSDDLKKERKFEEAIIFSDKAEEVKNEQKSPDFWYKRGTHCCEIGEYEEAVECFDKDLNNREQSFDAYLAKGITLFHLKKYAESVECLNKAAEQRNQQFLRNTSKVDHMKKMHKFEKAISYDDLTINEIILDENFWHHKGMALLKLKKYESAATCFKKALEIKEKSKILYDLAKTELLLGNEEKCIEILEKSCNLDSINIEKLRVDNDFSILSNNKQFRVLIGF